MQEWKQKDPNCTWLACPNRVLGKNEFNKKIVMLGKFLGYDNPETNKSQRRHANSVSNVVNKPGIVTKIQLGACCHSTMKTSAGYHKPNVEGIDCAREAVQDIKDDGSSIINLEQSDSRTSPCNSYNSEENIGIIGVMTQRNMEEPSSTKQCNHPPFPESLEFHW